MKSAQSGIVSSALIAVLSVGAVLLSALAIGNIDSITSLFSSASVRRANVRLLKGSVQKNFLKNPDGTDDQKKLLVSGEFCFADHLRTGSELWTIWASYDSGGRDYVRAQGESIPVSGGSLNAGGSYPAPCVGFDPQTGEAELQNKGTLQPHRFNLPLSFNSELSSANCPADIYLNYESNRQGGRGFARIDLAALGACGSTITPPPPTGVNSPTPATTEPSPTVFERRVTLLPTPNPVVTRIVDPCDAFGICPSSTPTPTPTTSLAVEGRVTVYSCAKPDYVQVNYCDSATGSERCEGLTYNRSDEFSPLNQGVWLDDDNTDNTWIYRYKISLDTDNQPLQTGSTVKFDPKGNPAVAFIGGTARRAEREDLSRLTVRVPGKRDFKIYAAENCGCSFHAVTQVMDEQGNLLDTFDGKPGLYGAANEKRITQIGDAPDPQYPFGNNGQPGTIEFFGDLNNPLNMFGYGRDALASVKAYVGDDYEVVEQSCRTSTNSSVLACPGYTGSWTKTDFSDSANPKVIGGLRVTCGADLTYGWKVKKSPRRTTGNGDMEVRVVALNWPEVTELLPASHIGSQEPRSCERLQTGETPNAQERPLYASSFEIKAKCLTCEDGFEKKDKVSKGKGYANFHNLPAGEYSLSIKGPHVGGFDPWPGCTQKTWTVSPGGTVAAGKHTRAVMILQNRAGEEYNHEGTERVCSEKQGIPNLLRPDVPDVYCYYPNGEQERREGGNVGQGGCSNELGLKCTGAMPDNARYVNNPGAVCEDRSATDSEISSAGYGWCGPSNNACCWRNQGGTGGGGSDNPINPPLPGGIARCGTSDFDYPTQCVSQSECNHEGIPFSCTGGQICCDSAEVRQPGVGGSSPRDPNASIQYVYVRERATDVKTARLINREDDSSEILTPTHTFDSGGRVHQFIISKTVNKKTDFALDLLKSNGQSCKRVNFNLEPKRVNDPLQPNPLDPNNPVIENCGNEIDQPRATPTNRPAQCPNGYSPAPNNDPAQCGGRPPFQGERGGLICCENPITRQITVNYVIENDAFPGSNLIVDLTIVDKETGERETVKSISVRNLPFLNKYSGFVHIDKNDEISLGKEHDLGCLARISMAGLATIAKACNNISINLGESANLNVRAFGRRTPNINATLANTNSEGDVAQADIDGNGVVNTLDYLLVVESYGAQTASLNSDEQSVDINGDGVVNAVDVSLVINYLGEEAN